MKKILEKVDQILKSDSWDQEKVFLHVAEELGELSRAARDCRNGRGSEDHLKEEAVDLVITSIAAYCAVAGVDVDFFEETFSRKCQKWKNGIEQKKSRN